MSRKSHAIDIKFSSMKNSLTKSKSMSEILIKHFCSQVMNIFIDLLYKRLWDLFIFFFVIKPKQNRIHIGSNLHDKNLIVFYENCLVQKTRTARKTHALPWKVKIFTFQHKHSFHHIFFPF